MPIAVAIFRLELDKEYIKKIVGDNPEYSIARIFSDVFKLGCLDLEIPTKLLEMGVNVKINVPREHLVDNVKPGKIGSYQIKKTPNGKVGKIPILRAMFSSYTNIDLLVS